MSTFQERLNDQLERQKTILKVHSNFTKENRSALKIVTRLQHWYKRIDGLWIEFRTAHDELTTFGQEFISSNYFTQRSIESVQAKVEAMKEKIAKILEKLGKPIASGADSVVPIPIEGSVIVEMRESQESASGSESDSVQKEYQPSQVEDEVNDEFKTPRAKPALKKPRFMLDDESETDSTVNDDFKTPRGKPSKVLKAPSFGVIEPFPSYIMRDPELKSRAEETVIRFKIKMVRFANDLDGMERYMSEGF